MIKQIIRSIKFKITRSLLPLSKLLIFIIPYIMYFIGKGEIVFSSVLILPILIFLIASILRRVSNLLIGIRDTFPVPSERFTSVGEDGEASVEVQRVYEMISYVADVEDWLQNKGLL